MTKADADPAAALAGLLDDERAALLAGELARLPEFIAAKERLLSRLEGAANPPPAVSLDALRAKAQDNQLLLDAALRGVQAARARLDVARGGGPALSTYDAKGRAETHGGARPSFERRA